jgi:class 3 adenylate cyclase
MRREVRRTVSVVFSDVAGSTALAERLDPESLRAVMTRYFEVARRVHERHGGVVEKFIGDAVMAVFGIPRAREDDALRAVRAAAELGEAVAMLNRELESELEVTLAIRTGVSTGLVVAGDERAGHAFVGGDTVNLAARLERAAGAGQVLLDEATYRLVAGAVRAKALASFVPRGRSAPVAAYRLLEVVADAPGLPRRLDAPLVGRSAELAVLQGMLDRAVALDACQLVTVVGDPGVGTSRLLRAFTERAAGRALVLEAACPASGGSAVPKVAGLIIGAAAPGDRRAWPVEVAASDPRRLFGGLRRLLVRLAADRPVALVVDDLHRADPLLLDLLEYLALFARDAALLLVAAGRRPPAGHPDPLAAVARARLDLDPLPAAEAAELATVLRGPGRVDGDRLAALAEGNPLLIEQALGDRDGAARALVAAELDELPPEERAVLETASVVGQVFDWPSVAALAPEPLGPRVGALLLALARRNLIRVADRGAGDDAFRFRNGLLREGAYEAIPMRRRLALHARAAELLATEATDAGHDEVVGYHLGQAYRYLAQLAGHDAAPPTPVVRPVHRVPVGVPA